MGVRLLRLGSWALDSGIQVVRILRDIFSLRGTLKGEGE